MLDGAERLDLSLSAWSIPGVINGHTGDGQSIQNHGNKQTIFEFIERLNPLRHTSLSVHDGCVVGVIVEMNVMIAVIFEPPVIQEQPDDDNRKDRAHNQV